MLDDRDINVGQLLILVRPKQDAMALILSLALNFH